MKMLRFYFVFFFCIPFLNASGQDYVAKVSRDSVAVLTSRIDVLKSAVKLNELKLSEASQEADIEKQKIRIIELRGSEKTSADESDRLSDALKKGTETDVKKVERMSRKANSKAKSLNNAIDKLQKQIDKVEDTRTLIETEERKLANRSPLIIYSDQRN